MGKKGKESSHHQDADKGEDPEAPAKEARLPCCGCGTGWFLFIIGFFLAAVPWYVAAFILICAKIDRREKPGYNACTIAAVLATVALTYGLFRLIPHLIPFILSLF